MSNKRKRNPPKKAPENSPEVKKKDSLKTKITFSNTKPTVIPVKQVVSKPKQVAGNNSAHGLVETPKPRISSPPLPSCGLMIMNK